MNLQIEPGNSHRKEVFQLPCYDFLLSTLRLDNRLRNLFKTPVVVTGGVYKTRSILAF